jgi:hypothetical protein
LGRRKKRTRLRVVVISLKDLRVSKSATIYVPHLNLLVPPPPLALNLTIL